MTPIKKTLKAAMVLLLLLLAGSLLYVPLKNIDAFLPRYGRVVDANTGEGLAHIPVIAFATIAGKAGWGPSGYGTLYRAITYTSTDGYYYVPAKWGSVPFAPYVPTLTWSRIDWAITALKVGYAVRGDEIAWELHPRGIQYNPLSISTKPHYQNGFWGLHIDPIRMEQVNLSLYEAANYYTDIVFAAGTYRPTVTPTEEEKALRRPVYDYFMPKVCALDPDTRLNWTAEGFVDEPVKYMYLAQKIRVEVEKKSPGQGTNADLIAGYQCKALKMAEDPRQ